MFHGLCDGLGLNRFIEAVLYHYCLRDGRKYSDEGIYTERIPYDPAEETDIHSNQWQLPHFSLQGLFLIAPIRRVES